MTMRRFNRHEVEALENRARQMLNLPQVSPAVVGPTGQASRIDEQILRNQAASEAGMDLRYDQTTWTEPERIEYGDGLFTFDEVIPEQTRTDFRERPGMHEALGEKTIDELIARGGPREYRSGSRKAGLETEDLGLSDKDMKTIDAAKAVIDKHLGTLGAAGLGATGAGILISGLGNDGDSRDNLQDAAVTAGLLGAGGFSGYAVGADSYKPMSERLAVRRQERGDTTPIQGRVFATDGRNRAARGRTGAVVGGGAGALLGLIQSLKTDEPQVYVYP